MYKYRSKEKQKLEYYREELPYGIWTCEGGRLVLFNRHYQPIWEKLPDGTVRHMPEHTYIDWLRQDYFYNDSNPPRLSKDTVTRCKEFLEEWGIGTTYGELQEHYAARSYRWPLPPKRESKNK